LGGKVTISHGFCLGHVTERQAGAAAELMATAGVALVTHGAGGLTLPPVEMLRTAGVLVFAGNDDIRDTWSPYGTGDLLERAAIIGWKGDFRRDDQVETAFDLVSAAGARALGIADYGVAVDARATLFTIPASGIRGGGRASAAQAGAAVRREDRLPRRYRAARPGADRLTRQVMPAARMLRSRGHEQR
jgi:cytosine deaminase